MELYSTFCTGDCDSTEPIKALRCDVYSAASAGELMARNNHRNGEPAYKRIQNAIRERIDSGQLKAGDVVDSERDLAKSNRVSLMTARHALADLAREGMVERR